MSNAATILDLKRRIIQDAAKMAELRAKNAALREAIGSFESRLKSLGYMVGNSHPRLIDALVDLNLAVSAIDQPDKEVEPY